MPHRKKGSQAGQWRRMDLHLHTPASSDFKQSNVTYLDFLRRAEEKNLDIIAFTDHNTATGYARYLEEVESLELLERLGRLREDERRRLEEYRRLRDKILILPGFEFTATLGFHILGIFPPDTTVRELEHLLLSLRVPTEKLDQGSGEVGATTDALTAYRMINEAGGLVIAAHANSSHGVAMPGFDFGGQTRIAYTQDSNLHALEVTDLDSKSRRRTAAFFSGAKPEYPRRMHCIQGSDAHKLIFDPRYKNEMGVGDRATEILLDDLSFEAIMDVLAGNDFSRTRPYRLPTEEPFDPIREAREQGDTLVQAFHERLHEKRGIARAIKEDVVALANTNGGTIYVGASSNPRQPAVGVERPDQAGAELKAAVSKEITPPLDVQVDVLKSQSKSVLQIIVPRGSEVPYALEGSYIYVRSENETGLAHRDEVVQLVRDALAVESAAAQPAGPVPEAQPGERAAPPAPEVSQKPEPAAAPTVSPPRTGVEIVSSEVRRGITYYAVRDLRNSRVVQNVTRASARRLWQYAIEEQEKNPCDASHVTWKGDIGLWKSHKRGGKVRYDLVQRSGGRLYVYYGVTDDGIHGEWRKIIEGEAGPEGEEVETEPRVELTLPVQTALELRPTEPASVGLEPVPTEIARAPEVEFDISASPRETGEGASEKAGMAETLLETAPPAATEPEALMPPSGMGGTELEGAAEEVAPQEPVEPPARGEAPPRYEPTVQDRTRAELAQPPPSGQGAQMASAAPPQLKSRAQEWREMLDRAIAEAEAAQKAAKDASGAKAPTSQINGEEVGLDEERAALQGQARAAEVAQSEEHVDDVERSKGAEEGRDAKTEA